MNKETNEEGTVNEDIDESTDDEENPELSTKEIVLNKANEVVLLLQAKNMSQLSSYVHPNKGVRFSPYLYVDVISDLVFNTDQINGFLTDKNVYTWGFYDGTGDSIELTPAEYFNDFVYSADFANSEEVSYNETLAEGNMIQNQFEVYPNANIVEYYFSGFDPQYEGMDWQSLNLVFEEYNGDWFLVGIIKGAWTI
ncbi:hypothetical protein [Chengkuizengella marina]|uniref:Uncharacterized protein n=1 Tax=Chengkuizengella marina TaxID=2507566 RepID=A0A6N9PX08_9BACL|nr:hypothetical protein [Chengkuizengella marina]NBI27446.1 hypothetical protein [Chengkuizengella marina]